MAREFSKVFYKSKQWRQVRQIALQQAHFMCENEDCNECLNLEVHHKIHLTPENIKDPKISLNLDNLKVLCRNCHFKEHEKDRIEAITGKVYVGDCDEGYYFDDMGNLRIDEKISDNSKKNF